MKGKSTRTGSRAQTKGKTDFGRLRKLTIRVDHDVVEWLKKKGSGYQTRINAILRSYMKAQSDEGADRRT